MAAIGGTIMTVAPPRIGRGTWLFVLGGALIAIGVFASAGGASNFGLGSALFGAGLVGVGFWSRLFYLVELRLIDLQRAALGETEVAPSKQPPAATGTPSEAYLG